MLTPISMYRQQIHVRTRAENRHPNVMRNKKVGTTESNADIRSRLNENKLSHLQSDKHKTPQGQA